MDNQQDSSKQEKQTLEQQYRKVVASLVHSEHLSYHILSTVLWIKIFPGKINAFFCKLKLYHVCTTLHKCISPIVS